MKKILFMAAFAFTNGLFASNQTYDLEKIQEKLNPVKI